VRGVSTPQIGKLKIEWLCLATAEMTAVLRGKHLAVAITEALRSNKLVVAKSVAITSSSSKPSKPWKRSGKTMERFNWCGNHV
jgi:hypothetical protein